MTIANIAFDSSYPTGGEALAANTLGMSRVDVVLAEPSAGFLFEYNHSTQALVAYQMNYPSASVGPAIEVANATDLSTVSGVRVVAIGV
jgi:hypothetical protein